MTYVNVATSAELCDIFYRPLNAQNLFKGYQRHLTSHHTELEHFGLLGDSEVEALQLEYVNTNLIFLALLSRKSRCVMVSVFCYVGPGC